MAEPFVDHPHLAGHHAPIRFEADAPDLIIAGKLSDDLAGIFYRNGPDPLYPPREGDYHWFDGDGRVSMHNRWVNTEKSELEKAAGRRLFGIHCNPMTSDSSVQGKRYDTGNTTVLLHGGQLLALMEGAPPVALDPRKLDTLHEETYGDLVTSSFSAHPKIDCATREMINTGAAIHGKMGPAEMRYDVVAADGTIRKTETMPMPHFSLMHTFPLTGNWAIFPFVPIGTDLRRFAAGGPMTAWVNDRPTKFAVMPREGTASEIKWFEFEPRHMFHELNVWEEDGKIIADVAAANGTALFPDETGARRTHLDTQQNLRRWTIDPHGNTGWIKEEVLNGRDIQFPHPDDRLITRKSRHSFANINLKSRDGRIEGMDAVLWYDSQIGEEGIWHFGAGAAAGELVFAPRLGSTDEADGYAMSLVPPANSGTSELAIFAAKDIAAGPIARVLIPFRVPSGIHCNVHAENNPLFQQTLAN